MQIHSLAFLLLFLCFVACQQQPENVPALNADLGFLSLASCQQGPEKAGASATNIIFQSTDGGQTWQDISAGLPEGVAVSRIFAGNGEVILCSESKLYHSGACSAAPAWETEVFKDIEISDIFPGQAGPYFSSYRKGLFQNLIGTGIVTPMHNTLEDKTVRTVLETTNGAVFVGCESGIFKSTDGGKNWKQVFAEVGVNSLVEGGDVLVCATYDGLLRSTDGGEHWDWVLTEDGSAYKTGYMDGRFVTITRGTKTWQGENAGGLTNRLRTSTDGGKTWQRMDESLSTGEFIYSASENFWPIRAIHDIKQSGKYLFCACDTGIFRSSDNGKNWEPVFPHQGKMPLQLAVSGQAIYAVLVVGC